MFVIWIIEDVADLRKPPADAASSSSREGKPYIKSRLGRVLPLSDSEGRERTSFRTLLAEFQSFHSKVLATSLVGTPLHLDPTRRDSWVKDVSFDVNQPLYISQVVPPAGNKDGGSLRNG